MILCGIDEAGRGPVIGPLVMAGVVIEEGNQLLLQQMGVKDSKLLTPKEREDLFKKILSVVDGYKIVSITPDVIDATLSSPNTNLNILEAHTSSEIINDLKPNKVIVDLPDRDAERYVSHIKERLNDKKTAIQAEFKADLNYPVVSAASILAKVTRDRYIEHLKESIDVDFGSGYTSDPKTIAFLEKNWNNPDINFFRKGWASWKNMEAVKTQKKLFDY